MRESLLRSELRERVAFPLSRVHYVETWRHGNAQKRRDLAEEMMIFSRLLTLAPAQMLWRHEIDHALHTAFGKPTEIAPIPAWGRAHCMRSATTTTAYFRASLPAIHSSSSCSSPALAQINSSAKTARDTSQNNSSPTINRRLPHDWPGGGPNLQNGDSDSEYRH